MGTQQETAVSPVSLSVSHSFTLCLTVSAGVTALPAVIQSCAVVLFFMF